MKRLFLVALVASICFWLSCKKETIYEGIKEIPVSTSKATETNNQLNLITPGRILYRSSDKDLREQITKNVQKLLDKNDIQSLTAQKGTTQFFPIYECPALMDATSVLKQKTVISGDFCSNTAIVEVRFTWNVIERNGDPQNALNYTFMVQPNILFGAMYTGTATLISTTPIYCHPEWGCWGYNKEYEVVVVMDQYNYTAATTNNTVTATSPCKAQAPVSISNTCSLDFPCSYYTTIPAIIYIGAVPTGVNVFTDCSICQATPPHVTCPNSVVFTYWSGINPPMTVTFPGSGGFISLPTGNYNYSCYTVYNCGNSLPKTGTFSIP